MLDKSKFQGGDARFFAAVSVTKSNEENHEGNDRVLFYFSLVDLMLLFSL